MLFLRVEIVKLKLELPRISINGVGLCLYILFDTNIYSANVNENVHMKNKIMYLVNSVFCFVKFNFLKATNMKMAAFCNVVPCILLGLLQ
jgi:hypothetical protein